MGYWLKINGEAIYSSKPWKFQNDKKNTNVWYTMSANNQTVYAILLEYTHSKSLVHLASPLPNKNTTINLLGYSGSIDWSAVPEKGGSKYFNGKL